MLYLLRLYPDPSGTPFLVLTLENLLIMKFYTIVAWISGILAVILMLLGAISLMLGNNLLGVRHEANFYIVANSFLLLAILCVLARQGCCCEKKD
jgi:hypothetical protein